MKEKDIQRLSHCFKSECSTVHEIPEREEQSNEL